MNRSTNYNMKKPEGTDFYNIADFNENTDVIDTQLKNAENHRGNTSNPHNVTKSQLNLGNVDNTSDLNKPISTATQTALDGKQAKINVSGVLKGDGTGNVTAASAFDIPNLDASKITTGSFADERIASASTWNGKQSAITANGILKGDGSGGVSAAVAGTDYASASHNQAASTISAGTFGGQVVANSSGETYSTYCLRNQMLNSSDTNPTVNGEICWTYS